MQVILRNKKPQYFKIFLHFWQSVAKVIINIVGPVNWSWVHACELCFYGMSKIVDGVQTTSAIYYANSQGENTDEAKQYKWP